MKVDAPGQPRLHAPAGGLDPAQPGRRAILVLGMHRCGTSALSGVLDALGVAGPKNLASANEWNQRGYFESPRIFNALDELLAAVGSSWNDWRQIDPRWLESAAGPHRQKLKQLLIEEFGDELLIFLKDPRICRFVPFVCGILAELDISPVAVLPLRNPLEVAHSLRRRDKIAPSIAVLIWLRHVLDAEFHSRRMPRCFLSFEDLLADWRPQMARVADKIDVAWPDATDDTSVKIAEFLSAELRHQQFSPDAIKSDPAVIPLARAAYDALTGIVADGENKALLDRLDEVRAAFDDACRADSRPVAHARQRRPKKACLEG
jgi:hypothetical protein